jgi:hypothetical protein
MEVTFIKLITILMTLPSFGVEANPSAPTSAEILKYAPAQADAMMYVDFGSFLPNNYRAMMSLGADPRVKADKNALAVVRDLEQKVRMGESMIKGMLGIDVPTSLQWSAGWISVPDAGDPDVLLVVRGTFPPDILDKASVAVGASVQPMRGGKIMVGPDGQSFGMATDGTVIMGTTKLVRERLDGKWKVKARFKRLPAILDAKPFVMLASSPSKRAIRRARRELSDPDEAFFRDFASNHQFAALSLRHDGLDWTWVDRSTAGFNRAAMFSEGLIELFRSGHTAVRGMSKIAMAIVSSYATQSPELAMLSRNEKLILDAVDAITGDGSFTARVDRNAKTKTVTVTARGKELAHVLPVAGVLPMAGAGLGFFLMRGGGIMKKESAKSMGSVKAEPARVDRKKAGAGAKRP